MPSHRTWPPAPEPLPLPVTDNHSHLEPAVADDAASDAWPSIGELTGRAASVGVTRIITIGCDYDAARWTADLLRRNETPGLRGGVAIHPEEAALHARGHRHDGTPLVPLDEAIAEIDRLLHGPGMVTVGETGLDYFRTSSKDEAAMRAQHESFLAHMDLAMEHSLPMQIHDRDAHADVLRLLTEHGAPERTVFHCFSGDRELARTCADAGYYVSFAGTVTFKNAPALREALDQTPLDRILVETDAPFLTPVPYRGRLNGSYLVPLTMREIARVKGIDLETACAAVQRTTEQVYGTWEARETW